MKPKPLLKELKNFFDSFIPHVHVFDKADEKSRNMEMVDMASQKVAARIYGNKIREVESTLMDIKTVIENSEVHEAVDVAYSTLINLGAALNSHMSSIQTDEEIEEAISEL